MALEERDRISQMNLSVWVILLMLQLAMSLALQCVSRMGRSSCKFPVTFHSGWDSLNGKPLALRGGRERWKRVGGEGDPNPNPVLFLSGVKRHTLPVIHGALPRLGSPTLRVWLYVCTLVCLFTNYSVIKRTKINVTLVTIKYYRWSLTCLFGRCACAFQLDIHKWPLWDHWY